MRFLPFIFLVLIFSLPGFSQVGDLIWEDNFNENQLDLSKWSYETGTGVNGDWGTGQLDRATDRPENVSFKQDVPGAEDGCLVITTRKEFYIDRNYTSGRIKTAGKASWGPGHRIVAKIFPEDVKYKGQGFAYWMMPDEIPAGWSYIMWPQGGEIDIMEYVGSIPFHNLGGVHYAWFWENNQWQSWNHGHQAAYYSFEHHEVPDPSEPGYGGYPPAPADTTAGSYRFHTYGIDWLEDRMEFFVDDHVYHIHYLNDGGAYETDGQDEFAIERVNNKRVGISEYSNHFEEWHPFEHKMYAILSAGVGGSQNTYGGAIVPEAIFPCSVYIDWVRVYELDSAYGINPTSEGTGIHITTNPSCTLLTVRPIDQNAYFIRICNINGKTIIHSAPGRSAEINISGLPDGIYIVLVGNGKFSISKKILIRH